MDDAIVNYLNKHANWPQLALAHQLLLAHGFSAAIKWNAPVYMLDGKNLVGLGGFKQHCAVWFFNGVLLNDPQNKLLNAQEGKTQTLRQWRFGAGDTLDEAYLAGLLAQVKHAHQQGTGTPQLAPKQLTITEPFCQALAGDAALQSAFDSLSPGKQRDYADYITEAKQEATKHNRLDKIIPMIKAGMGLNDKYKNC